MVEGIRCLSREGVWLKECCNDAFEGVMVCTLRGLLIMWFDGVG